MVTLSVLAGVTLAAGSYLLWLRPVTPEPATALTTMRPPGAGTTPMPHGGATGSVGSSAESAPPTDAPASTQPTTAAEPPPAPTTTAGGATTPRLEPPQAAPSSEPDKPGRAAGPEDPGPRSSIPPTADTGPPAAPSIPPAVETIAPTSEVVQRVNAERATVGCGPVRIDARLTAVAQAHSDDMSAHAYLSHDSRTGQDFGDRIAAGGYPEPAAENIAMGLASPEAVMDAWMSSPGHRENILDCEITAIGVGVNTSGWYWTQDFGY